MSGPTTEHVAANSMDALMDALNARLNVTACSCKWILVQSGTCCYWYGGKRTHLEHAYHRRRILSLSLTLVS